MTPSGEGACGFPKDKSKDAPGSRKQPLKRNCCFKTGFMEQMLLFSETRYQPRVTGWCCCGWQAGSETPHPADTVSFQMSTVWNATRAGQPRTIKSRKVTVQDVARLVFLFCFFFYSLIM